jgi:hypothetical protein
MTPERAAVVPELAALAEKYMDVLRPCFLCQEAPAVTPLVFVADGRHGTRVRGAVVAVCAVCLCSEDFQARIEQALSTARARGQAIWN